MIRLVIAQLATRWVQAVVLLLLSAAVTAAAVSAPVFASAVDRSTLATELAAADESQLVASLPLTIREWPDAPDAAAYNDVLSALPGFTYVTTYSIQVRGLREDAGPSDTDRLVARDGFCRHVVFHAGRCPAGSREAALPAVLAEQTGLGPGDQVLLEPTRRFETTVMADGPPAQITVVGVFDAADRADPYWVAGYDPLGRSGFPPAIFTNVTVLQTMEHTVEQVSVDAILPGSALTPERIPRLRERLTEADARVRAAGLGEGLLTDIPVLLDRIDGHGQQVRRLLPVAAAPLVALGWLVIFVAVAHGVSARRHETAVVALRGAKRWTRAVAVTLEHLVPVLVGIPVGVAGAYLLAWLAGPEGVPVALTTDQLVAAGLAAGGTAAAVLVALRRELAAPVAQLLRQAPRRRRAAVAAVELLVAVLALVVVADLRLFDRDLVGLMVVAPAVVMVAVVVLAARVVAWANGAAGRWWLRRGRLGPALAALYLSRRPGAVRLVVALGLALGMLGFAVASTDVAGQGRATEAERTLGAARVLEISRADPAALLGAVRAVDPAGQYAMAAVRIPASRTDPARLVVDATRLAEVAVWPDAAGVPAAAQVAELLRPRPGVEPVVVGDGELVAELTPDESTPDGSVQVSARLVPVAGGRLVTAAFGPLAAERRRYAAEVTGCAEGCRLAGLGFTVETTEERVGVTIHDLRGEGGRPLGADQLTDPDRWRGTGARSTSIQLAVAGGGGLAVTIGTRAGLTEAILLPADTPDPLPVVSAGLVLPADLLTNLDGAQVRVVEAASVAALPGLAEPGAMLDLEYAQRSLQEPGVNRAGEVWLAADAPAGAAEQLREAGLAVTEQRSVSDLRDSAGSSGAALALRFFLLAAGIAVAVGLLAFAVVVVVDRGGWSAGLRDLRTQGVRERTVLWAGVWSYGGVVLAAAVAGATALGAAWLATGDRLPLGVERAVLPAWPHWAPVLLPWTVVVAALLAAAVVGAWWQRGAVRKEVRG